ncbi:hypothetical protein TNCV_3386041 [Trichonephila clavipes]|nr:hypothetical protein TNCV_3386041 [Trichonephila clavipes]
MCGRGSLEVKVSDSSHACLEFESSAAEARSVDAMQVGSLNNSFHVVLIRQFQDKKVGRSSQIVTDTDEYHGLTLLSHGFESWCYQKDPVQRPKHVKSIETQIWLDTVVLREVCQLWCRSRRLIMKSEIRGLLPFPSECKFSKQSQNPDNGRPDYCILFNQKTPGK